MVTNRNKLAFAILFTSISLIFFSPTFLHLILGLFINWHNLSTLASLRLFSGRPEFLLCKAIHKLNFQERVCTISFLFFGLFGKAFIIFLNLLLFTDLLENEDSGEFGIWFSFDLSILIPYALFFYRCNLTRSFTFNKAILYFFLKASDLRYSSLCFFR